MNLFDAQSHLRTDGFTCLQPGSSVRRQLAHFCTGENNTRFFGRRFIVCSTHSPGSFAFSITLRAPWIISVRK
ncbi:hypothetical protein OKW43_003395 [Paraburkholderia sp. WC7.3g]